MKAMYAHKLMKNYQYAHYKFLYTLPLKSLETADQNGIFWNSAVPWLEDAEDGEQLIMLYT